MKIKGKLKLISVIILAILCQACGEDKPYKPTESQNPWPDDYSQFISLNDRAKWGTYNVHDPSIKKFGDTYYSFSTDHVFFGRMEDVLRDADCTPGYIDIRKSKDLVHWDFVGWAFDSIPFEALNYVDSINNYGEFGRTSKNLWAPYVLEMNGVYRMYYCLSTFGKKNSFIGLAEAENLEGPWIPKGCVVKTDTTSVMNAIDPTVMQDMSTGKYWMIYGSFFCGIFAVELDEETGLTAKAGDQGHLVAHRKNWQRDNMEAPDILYNKENGKYYLFVSYGPLVTNYNVRVSVSDHPQGPYKDYFGNDVAKEINSYPILTAPYRFDNHPGWAGMAHCSVFDDGEGNYYLASQGRLQPENMKLNLCVRQMFFNRDGWPFVSPERYAGDQTEPLSPEKMRGEWEIVIIEDREAQHELVDGQVVSTKLQDTEVNISKHVHITERDIINFDDSSDFFDLSVNGKKYKNLKVFVGHDWENSKKTLLFSGLDVDGHSVWGKKIN